jgi:6-pyruvoyltetrahydropterin/6-carboxytetrahydropterin synthase
MRPTLSVTKEFSFAAAHSLPDYNGPCANLHGHEWKLLVEVTGPVSDAGMVMDFVKLKAIVNEAIVNKMDHEHLNKLYPNPTAELMVLAIVEKLSDALWLDFEVSLTSVVLYETPTSKCEWRRK